MTGGLQILGGVGGSVLATLVEVGLVKASVLLGIAAGGAWALRRRSAASRHLVFAGAVAILLMLPLASVGLPAWNALPAPSAAAPATHAASVPTFVSPAPPPAAAATPGTAAAEPATPQAGVAPVPAPPPSGSDTIPASVWILGAWLCGVLVVLGRFALGLRRLGAITRRGETPGPPLLARATRLERALDISRPVRLRLSTETAVPLTFGLCQPVVVLPAGATGWPAERVEAVLAHELVHVRRRDCATQALAQVACALYWFNPLVWLAARRLRAERERACDDRVLGLGVPAADYAAQLVQVARAGIASPAAGASLAMARRSGLEQRIVSILDSARRRRPPSRRAAGGLALVGLALALPLAVVGSAPSIGAGQTAGAPPASFLAILARPQTPGDRLPGWVARDPLLAGKRINRRTIRLAFTEPGRSYYVAVGRPYPRGSLTVCLIDASLRVPPLPAPVRPSQRGPVIAFFAGPGGSAGVNCQTAPVFDRYFVAALLGLHYPVAAVDGIVPDGYTSVSAGTQTAAVHGNVFVLRGIDSSQPLVARGPAGERTYSLALAPFEPRSRGGVRLPVALLSRPLTAADRPPIRRGSGPAAGISGIDWDHARLAATVGGTRYYVAPSHRPEVLMELTLRPPGHGRQVSYLRRPTVIAPFSVGATGSGRRPIWAPQKWTISGVAADGYERVSAGRKSAPIRNNFFVLPSVEVLGTVKITVSGPAGEASSYLPAGPGQMRDHIPTSGSRLAVPSKPTG